MYIIFISKIRILVNIFNGLYYALAHKGLSGPHLFAESMVNMERGSKFLIGVMSQVLIWVEGDVFDPKDKAYQSIRNVRSLHSHIGKKMNEREKRVEGQDVLWVNQLGNSFNILNKILESESEALRNVL